MGGKNSYFYSIQPFWNSVARAEKEIEEEGISLCRMEWDAKKWTCIPGN